MHGKIYLMRKVKHFYSRNRITRDIQADFIELSRKVFEIDFYFSFTSFWFAELHSYSLFFDVLQTFHRCETKRNFYVEIVFLLLLIF